jgi:hypothetical protein
MREQAHANLLAGGPPFTIAFFVDHRLDRIENYDSLDLAIFRAQDVKRSLLDDGWVEAGPLQ